METIRKQIPQLELPQNPECKDQNPDAEGVFYNPVAATILYSHKIRDLKRKEVAFSQKASSRLGVEFQNTAAYAKEILQLLSSHTPELFTDKLCIQQALIPALYQAWGRYSSFTFQALHNSLKPYIESIWDILISQCAPAMWTSEFTYIMQHPVRKEQKTSIINEITSKLDNFDNQNLHLHMLLQMILSKSKKPSDMTFSEETFAVILALEGMPRGIDTIPHFHAYLRYIYEIARMILDSHPQLIASNDPVLAYAELLSKIEPKLSSQIQQKAVYPTLHLLYMYSKPEHFTQKGGMDNKSPTELSSTVRTFFITQELKHVYYALSEIHNHIA